MEVRSMEGLAAGLASISLSAGCAVATALLAFHPFSRDRIHLGSRLQSRMACTRTSWVASS